jgi:hypothetical protein
MIWQCISVRYASRSEAISAGSHHSTEIDIRLILSFVDHNGEGEALDMPDLRTRVRDRMREVGEFFQDQWFDRTRHVHTSGDVSLALAGISAAEVPDSEYYVPARPEHIREALRAIPVEDVSSYSYIDLGSGKGRTLFVAADLPFRQIIGVELSNQLNEMACRNVTTFDWRKRQSREIKAIQMNAADFQFPAGPMVIYMFNPFGEDTMGRVLGNLAASLERDPRHVIIILLWPRCGNQVMRLNGMRLISQVRHFEIFEAHAPYQD